MIRDPRSMVATALLAVGAAALVFAWTPGAWPNPLPDGPVGSADAVRQLAETTSAVAEACARGDVPAFAAATTGEHRERVARRLAAVDGVLDGATLQTFGAEAGRIDWCAQPLLAGEVRGVRTAIAVARPDGDGAQLLSFVWDGRRMRFDGARHAPSARSPAAARAAVEAVVAEPR